MVNIVVFGKAQSGKSTLLGYLYSKSNKKFNINEFERKTKAQLENSYRPSYLFAYIMDESKDERIIKPGTRKLHIRKIALNEFTRITVIDTPGAEHHIHPNQKKRLPHFPSGSEGNCPTHGRSSGSYQARES